MKFIKILAACLAILPMTACSDSDEFNTESGVSVELAQSEITVRENTGIFNVPIKLDGKTNGNVRVTIKVEGTGENPASPFEEKDGKWSGNFIVTSKTVNIPEGVSEVNIEINTKDDFDENPDRTFTVTIVSAEGATIGNIASTIVTLKDNDSIPYEKIQGDWNFNFISQADPDKKATSWNVSIKGFDEKSPNYGKLLNLDGLTGQEFQNEVTSLDLDFHNDLTSGETFVEMVLPEPIAVYNSSNYVWAMRGEINEEGRVSLDLKQSVTRGDISQDYKTISFDPEVGIAFVVASPDLRSILGVLEVSTDISMTR